MPSALPPITAWDRWKVTFPVGQRKNPTKPQEFTGPELADLPPAEWARLGGWLRPDGAAVVMSAPVVGPTTPNSRNLRCELRELDARGGLAAWSTTSGGPHGLDVDVTPTRIPTGNPGVGVVVAQIHDADDDVTVWRVEADGLWLAIGDKRKDWKLIDPAYRVGTRIQVGFTADQGVITCRYQGKVVAAVPARKTGCYFRTGCYVQANAGAKPADTTNTGAVILHAVRVTHGTDTAGPPVPDPVPADPPAPAPGPPTDLPPPPPGALDWWRKILERFGKG